MRQSLEGVSTPQHRENPKSVGCPQPSCSRVSMKDYLHTKGNAEASVGMIPGKSFSRKAGEGGHSREMKQRAKMS